MWRGVVVCLALIACSESADPPVSIQNDAAVTPGGAECFTVGDAGCVAGQTCVFEYDTGSGRCVVKGSAALGAPCDEMQGSSGCAEGVCRAGVCVAFCDPFADTSPCPSSNVCTTRYECSASAFTVDPSAVEHFCATDGAACGSDIGIARGQCVPFYSIRVCREQCRVGVATDCPASMVCAQPLAALKGGKLGVCMPALDQSACVDGGSGTCADCQAAESASDGCCASEAAACTTQACRDFMSCAIACKRGRACVEACAAVDSVATLEGTPLLLCLSGFGAPPGGACGDVCGGQPVCGNYDGPDTASTCVACDATSQECRANGCFNNYYCDRTTMMCTAPTSVPSCTN